MEVSEIQRAVPVDWCRSIGVRGEEWVIECRIFKCVWEHRSPRSGPALTDVALLWQSHASAAHRLRVSDGLVWRVDDHPEPVTVAASFAALPGQDPQEVVDALGPDFGPGGAFDEAPEAVVEDVEAPEGPSDGFSDDGWPGSAWNRSGGFAMGVGEFCDRFMEGKRPAGAQVHAIRRFLEAWANGDALWGGGMGAGKTMVVDAIRRFLDAQEARG